MKTTESVLKEVEKNIKIEASKKLVPKEFFVDRKGLYVSSSFESYIIEKAEPTKKESSFEVSSFELLKSSSDEKIEGSLPNDHLFSETDVCAIIASLIEKQPEGQEGTLLNNGYANLFYTFSHVVGVFWSFVDGEWRVFAWRRGGRGWVDGLRVFSPATEA